MKTSEAVLAAADARKEGLLGKYPLAAQVLAEEVFRLRGEVEAERKACANPKGRRAIAKDGELMKTRPVRMTDAEWLDCQILGGTAGRSCWVRKQIADGMKKKKRAGRNAQALLVHQTGQTGGNARRQASQCVPR